MARAPLRKPSGGLGDRSGRRRGRRFGRCRDDRARDRGGATVSAARSTPGPGSRAFVDWTLRWGGWLWAVAIAVAIPATWRTAQLYMHLRSEIEQLLPNNAESVRAIDEL